MADIAINPVSRRVQFTGNTGTGPFAFTFNILADEDITVYKNTTLLTLTTDYTVATSADGTGSVTLVAALVASDVLTIIGGRELERTTDFVTAGDLLAESLNEQLDSLVIMAQQLDEKMTRSFKVNPGDQFTDLEMPLLDDRKGKYLAFNATTGDPEAGPDQTDIVTLSAITSDIATLADIEDGTDATDAIQTVAGISSNVSTVAGISSNVTTVAGISSDVTTVAGISSDVDDLGAVATEIGQIAAYTTEINTIGDDLNSGSYVAGGEYDFGSITDSSVGSSGSPDGFIVTVYNNMNDINTVGGISANVTTVAGISSDVTAVAGDASDIGTVATNISSVNTVATNIADVITVANDLNEAVSEVVTVADDLNEAVSEIDTVATSISNVDTVGTNIANVNTVAGISANVTTVAGISANTTTVAGISSNVTTVAGISANVTTVAGISSDVTTVASDSADIQTVADNLNSINDFADKYRIGATDPTTDNDEGDLFYNTTSDTLKVYDGSAWVAGVTAGSGFLALSGGTMTGALTLSGAPTSNLHAATKAYVDTTVAATNEVVEDTTPQLGGNLDVNGNSIVSVSNGDISITPNGTGSVVIDGLSHPQADGSAGQFLKTDGAGQLAFATVDTDLSNDTTPQLGGDLDGQGNNIYSLQGNIGSDAGDYLVWTTDTRMDVYVNGSNEFRFESDGDFHADGDVVANSTTISDKRLKSNIEKIDGALDMVMSLSGYTFNYNGEDRVSAGVIAQEVEKVLPSAVIEKRLAFKGDGNTDYKVVQYDQLHALLIEAIKEQQAQIDALSKRIGDS